MFKNIYFLYRLALAWIVLMYLTGCGVLLPFTEEEWETIFEEKRNNFLFASDAFASGRINILQIDDNSGSLTYTGQILSTMNSHLSSDLEGSALFATNFSNLTFFPIKKTGELLPSAPGSTSELSELSIAIVFDKSGSLVYLITNKAIYPFHYNKQTQTLTSLARYSPQIDGLPVTILGAASCLKNNRLFIGAAVQDTTYFIVTYAVNTPDNADSLTQLATTCCGEAIPRKICIHPSGHFLYTGNTEPAPGKQFSALKINTNGSLTYLDSYTVIAGSPYNPVDMIIDPAGRYLFATITNAGNNDYVFIFLLNTKTGKISGWEKYNLDKSNLTCLATDPWGRYLYVSAGDLKEAIYMLKISNNALVKIDGSPYVYDKSSVDYAVSSLCSVSKKL